MNERALACVPLTRHGALEEGMWLDKSKVVPTAFWIGFLALGVVTSLDGPDKHRVLDRAATWSLRTAAASRALLAQTEPQNASVGAKTASTTP